MINKNTTIKCGTCGRVFFTEYYGGGSHNGYTFYKLSDKGKLFLELIK